MAGSRERITTATFDEVRRLAAPAPAQSGTSCLQRLAALPLWKRQGQSELLS